MKSSAQPSPSSAPARVHLRIQHPQLAPEDITAALSIDPEHTLEAGRGAAMRVRADCYWIAPLVFAGFDDTWSRENFPQVGRQTMSHEALVAFALRQLQPHQHFFRRIGSEGGSATLLITTDAPGSMTILPSLARKLADTGLSLELDWSGNVE